MGYRFTLETANTVANLTFGKVLSCYRSLCESEEVYWGFRYFLKDFESNFFSDDNEKPFRDVRYIRRLLEEDFNKLNFHREFDDDFPDYNDIKYRHHRMALDALRDLSLIFSRCHVKSLLLPQVICKDREYREDYMTSQETLHRILKWHPGDSCLILQPDERPVSDGLALFDTFPHFDAALRQIDRWPAVMFWTGEEEDRFVFVPIDNKSELLYLYETIHYEKYNPLSEIRRLAAKKEKKPSHYYIHLSDLHFGAKDVGIAERRLRSLVRKQVESFDIGDSVGFVVSGDGMDSPNKENKLSLMNFCDFLQSYSHVKPSVVPGNHDFNTIGLALNHHNQSFADIIADYPIIIRDDEAKVLFLLFNSNIKGHFAGGEIGTEQLSEMGNQLDETKELDRYRLIAVLHHHVTPIPNPEWRTEKWYKKILPQGFLEQSLKLRDADFFMNWLKKRNVQMVLHGHKHIPFATELDGIKIIACGSSTGRVTHVDKGKTYMSYNVLKIEDDSIVCMQYVEDIPDGGTDVLVEPLLAVKK
jgi:predicted phosphodiesterase